MNYNLNFLLSILLSCTYLLSHGQAPIDAGPDQNICNGYSATIVASGGVSYVWDSGLGAGAIHTVSPSVTTTYSVTGIDAGGNSGIDSVTIFVNPLPFVILDPFNPSTVCNTDSIVPLPDGTPLGGYYGGAIQPGSPTPISGTYINPTISGTFLLYYTYTDSLGCSSTDSSFLTIDNCLGIEELLNGSKKLIHVFDLNGRESEDKPNTMLIYIYSDGTTKRVYRVE